MQQGTLGDRARKHDCGPREERGTRVGILGVTFKENVPDVRNSKVIDLVGELKEFGLDPLVHDPLADPEAVRRSGGIELSALSDLPGCAAIVLAVPHEAFANLDAEALGERLLEGGVLVDLKSRVEPNGLRSDILYWSL